MEVKQQTKLLGWLNCEEIMKRNGPITCPKIFFGTNYR
jgi:hypothetical protein